MTPIQLQNLKPGDIVTVFSEPTNGYGVIECSNGYVRVAHYKTISDVNVALSSDSVSLLVPFGLDARCKGRVLKLLHSTVDSHGYSINLVRCSIR